MNVLFVVAAALLVVLVFAHSLLGERLIAIAPKSAASDQIATAIAAGLFVCGLLSGIVARGRHFSWAVFLACSALVWFGI